MTVDVSRNDHHGSQAVVNWSLDQEAPNVRFGLRFQSVEAAVGKQNFGLCTKPWLRAKFKNLADCAAEGSFDFTTIGGIFTSLSFAEYTLRVPIIDHGSSWGGLFLRAAMTTMGKLYFEKWLVQIWRSIELLSRSTMGQAQLRALTEQMPGR